MMVICLVMVRNPRELCDEMLDSLSLLHRLFAQIGLVFRKNLKLLSLNSHLHFGIQKRKQVNLNNLTIFFSRNFFLSISIDSLKMKTHRNENLANSLLPEFH